MSMGRERCNICGDEHGACYDCEPAFNRTQQIKKKREHEEAIRDIKIKLSRMSTEEKQEVIRNLYKFVNEEEG